MKKFMSLVLVVAMVVGIMPIINVSAAVTENNVVFQENFDSFKPGDKYTPPKDVSASTKVTGFKNIAVDSDSDNKTSYIAGNDNAAPGAYSSVEFLPVSEGFSLDLKVKGYTSTAQRKVLTLFSGETVVYSFSNVNSKFGEIGILPEGSWYEISITIDPTATENNFQVFVDGTLRAAAQIENIEDKPITKIGFHELISIDDIKIKGDSSKAMKAYNDYVARLQPRLNSVKAKVDKLPESTNEEKLAKASYRFPLSMVEVALAASKASYAIIKVKEVEPLINSVLAGLNKKAVNSTINKAEQDRLMIRFSDHNPYAAKGLFAEAEKAKTLTVGTRVNNGRVAIGLFHPQSPVYLDPQVFEVLAASLYQSTKDVIEIDYDKFMGFYLMKKICPNLLMPEIQDYIEKDFRASLDGYMPSRPSYFTDEYIANSAPNLDTRYMLSFAFMAHTVGDQKYIDAFNTFINQLTNVSLIDGGGMYAGRSLEASTYHDAVPDATIIAWMMLENKDALKIALSNEPYPMMSGNERGALENYTSASWKHYWNMIGTGSSYYLSALIGNPYYSMFRNPGPNIFAAFAYETGIKDGINQVYGTNLAIEGTGIPKKVELPMSYTIYDRSIQGPKGKYPEFNYGFFGKELSYWEGKDEGQGIPTNIGYADTSVGGFEYLYSKDEMNSAELKKTKGYSARWPVNVAADIFTFRFYQGDTAIARSIVDKVNSSSMTDTISSIASSGVSGSKGRFGPIGNINIDQEWTGENGRLFGLVGAEFTENIDLNAIVAVNRFVSGRSYWGILKQFKKLDANTYQYGDIKVRIHSTNLKDTRFIDTETWGGSWRDYIIPSEGLKAQYLALTTGTDTTFVGENVTGPSKTYNKGAQVYYIIEMVTPDKELSKDVKYINDKGLKGFQFTDNDKTVTLIHNTTLADVTTQYDLPANYSNYSVHVGTDPMVTRDKYFNTFSYAKYKDKNDGNKFEALSSGKGSYTVPARRQIMIIGSNNPEDHNGKYKYYEDMFKNPIPIETGMTLNDISSHWAQSDIQSLVNKGSVNGYPDSTFKPDNDINVDEFTKIIIKLLGMNDIKNGETYWAENYIAKAKELSLIRGDEFSGDFSRPITRVEISRLIGRALGDNYGTGSVDITFTDKADISESDLQYVKTMLWRQVVTGYEDGTFKPNSNATRAEAATMLMRYLRIER